MIPVKDGSIANKSSSGAKVFTDTVCEGNNMSHELDFTKDNTARMAYATGPGRAVPWHRLGVPMKGLQTVDAMLAAASADFDVLLTKVAAVDDYGNLIRNADGTVLIINDSRATVRQNNDGSFDALATVGTRYVVRQNHEVLERAIAVVGASDGDAVMDTVGVLRGGARFFATIDLGAVVIDPMGVNDKISRYLVVSTGHDGVWPIRYANTDIRAVCNNTVVLGLKQAERVFTARHTRNVDTVIEDARTVLRISTNWADEFKAEAERMLAIPVLPKSRKLSEVIDGVFPIEKDQTSRQKKHRDETISKVLAIYGNDRNAGAYGYNGWSIYNAIAEYFDHHRTDDPIANAMSSMDDTSVTTVRKLTAHRLVVK
jgi:phage/plasmid-like protein (TIGR03299 family)